MPFEETMEETIRRLFGKADPGDWMGVFENKEIGHPDCGRKIALVFDQSQEAQAKVGQTHAPDHHLIGLGWRWLLVAICHTPAEAIAAMEDHPVAP